MADKEATVYIVDVGKSSKGMRHGRSESDLEYAMKYVWERITNTVRCLSRAGYALTFVGPHWAQNGPCWRCRLTDRRYSPPRSSSSLLSSSRNGSHAERRRKLRQYLNLFEPPAVSRREILQAWLTKPRVQMPQVRDLLGKITPSETNDGDGEAGPIDWILTNKKSYIGHHSVHSDDRRALQKAQVEQAHSAGDRCTRGNGRGGQF